MKRAITLIAAMLLALAMMAGPAAAFSPPGEADVLDDVFPCMEEGEDQPDVHPGSAGLAGEDGATMQAAGNTMGVASVPHVVEGDLEGASLTAWNAAFIPNLVESTSPC